MQQCCREEVCRLHNLQSLLWWEGEYVTTGKQRALLREFCGMIKKDMMPVSTIDGEGFQELIHFMEPGHNIPSRPTITTHLEARYKNKKAELKTQLAAPNVALTKDCWTALTTESYITITCHYIENDWQVKSAVLLTQLII